MRTSENAQKLENDNKFTKISEIAKLFREIKQKMKMLFCKYPELQRSGIYDKINVQNENQTKIL